MIIYFSISHFPKLLPGQERTCIQAFPDRAMCDVIIIRKGRFSAPFRLFVFCALCSAFVAAVFSGNDDVIVFVDEERDFDLQTCLGNSVL